MHKISLFKTVAFGLLFLTVLGGCKRNDDEPAVSSLVQKPVQNPDQQSRQFLSAPITVQRVEISAEALAIWRQYSEQRPTLLLLSNHPLLIPVPETLRAEVATLVATAPRSELAARGTLRRPDPLLLPKMTVDAALRSDWFGQLAWALPLRDADMALSVETFRQQIQESGIATEDESATFSLHDSQVHGRLRNTPFVAAALPNLPAFTGPVIVHFDQSYFQKIYKNEIATPILPLVYDTLKTLRQRQVQVLAATFASGNLEGRVSLDVRFIGEVIRTLLMQPERFDQPQPMLWQLQANILYLDNFFQNETILETAREMNKLEPDSAWVKFSLYRAAAKNKLGTEALEYLSQAVAIDPIYALEYLALSEMAYEKKRPDQALRMLQLAQQAFPDNFQILLHMADLTAEQGEFEAAWHILEPLQAYVWSTVYYPDMPERLQRLMEPGTL